MKKIYSLLLLTACLFGAQNALAQQYYVCGSMNEWTNPGDLMTYDSENNCYYKIYGNLSGSYQFKINVGSWSQEWNFNSVNNSLGDITLTKADGTSTDIIFDVSGIDVVIYFREDGENSAIWASEYVTEDPIVHLSPSAVNLFEGDAVLLTATAEHFSGEVTYAFSYSTDNGETFTPIAGENTNIRRFVIGAAGTAYIFKVVATYNTESAEATTQVYSVVLTVAGSYSYYSDVVCPVFGSYWDATDANNDMTYDHGTGMFTLMKDHIYLPTSDNLVFKVTFNHKWDESYPGSDYFVDMNSLGTGPGYYSFIFTFNWNTQEVNCIANYLHPKVDFKAGFLNNEWTAVEMTYAEDNAGAYVEYELLPGLYDKNNDLGFMVRFNDAAEWYGADAVMYRDNCTNWSLTDQMSLCGFMADVPGMYKFYCNFSNLNMTMGYPISFTRESAGESYQTLCVPFDAMVENALVYTGTVNGSSFMLEAFAYNSLTAGITYIIKTFGAPVVISRINDNQVGGPSNPLNHDTGLYGVLGEAVDLGASDDVYVLSGNEFHKLEGSATATVASTKGYLHIHESEGAPIIRIVENATNLENVESETAQKFIQNGNLYIMRNGVMYDVTGTIVR